MSGLTLISQNGDIIVSFDLVALVVEEDGVMTQIIAYTAGDYENGLVMAEYYSKDDALKQIGLVLDASQFASRFRFAEA